MIIAFIIILLLCILAIGILYWKRNIKSNQMKLKEIHDILLESYTEEIPENISIKIPIYYINLDRSEDRRDFMEDQFKRYHIKATRVKGIDGKNLNNHGDVIDISDNKRIQFKNNYTNNSLGELGCTLSHIKAIYTSYINGDKYSLILEDDTSFALYPFWNISLESIIKNAPKDWNIITLFDFKCSKIEGKYIEFNVHKPCYSTTAYIINRKGMENILYDILHRNEIFLDRKDSKFLASDVSIYNIAKNTYHYKEYSIFFPYNDSELRNSTIHSSHTNSHITKALETVDPYLIKTKKKIIVRKHWTNLKSEIPKIIHVIWYKWKSDKPSENMQKMLKVCKDVNNDFTYKVWDEKSGLELIKNYYSWFLNTYNKYDVEIKRIDAIRYFILFHYGGVYMDMDTICLKNISPLLKKGNAIFGYQLRNKKANGAICNSFMASPSNHPLFENIIYKLKDTAKKSVIYSTGPGFLTEQIRGYKGNNKGNNKGDDVIVYDMHIFFTNQWNEKSIASKCISDTSPCKKRFPRSYTTTNFSHSWL